MARYQFNDEESAEFTLIPAGDYVWEITSVDFKIRSQGKTAGSESFEAKLMLYKDECCTDKLGTIREELIFHPSTAWKIDCMLKSGDFKNSKGQVPQKGEELDIDDSNLIGLRGWCAIKVESFTRQDGTKGQINKVSVFYTNKKKIARNAPVESEPEPVITDDDLAF